MSKYSISVFFLVAAFSLYAAEKDITFPVVELDNCENKEACFAYCEDAEHLEACVFFAETNGLMSAEEAKRARSFGIALAGEGGPGACRNEEECKLYCSSIAHIDECVSFAERQGHSDSQVEEGKRIRDYLKSGGTMPGGCTSKNTCEAYCSNVTHMEECIAFAEKVDIVMRDGHTGEDISPEKLRQIMTLMQDGKTPGGCTSKEACENYCQGGDHFDECIVFGEQLGFVSAEEAAVARKTGGKGPGGCQSRESCDTFCNDPANQNACFEFARAHGLVGEKSLEQIQKGATKIKQSLSGAPPEVKDCINVILGPEATEKALSGNFLPGPGVGERLHECFQMQGFPSPEVSTNGPGLDENQNGENGKGFGVPTIDSFLGNLPTEVADCVRTKAPSSALSREIMEPIMRECFGENQQGQVQLNPEQKLQNQPPVKYGQPYNEQYKQQYDGQYEEQYQERYRQDYEQQSQEQQQDDLPVSEQYQPPVAPMEDTAPVSRAISISDMLGAVLAPFILIFF
ncbi:MAG TPA: hypothetical protein VJI73_03530 [Candidatus Paceibacterota bacterium]